MPVAKVVVLLCKFKMVCNVWDMSETVQETLKTIRLAGDKPYDHSKLNSNILYNKSTFPTHLLLLYLLFIYSIILLFVSVFLSLQTCVCARSGPRWLRSKPLLVLMSELNGSHFLPFLLLGLLWLSICLCKLPTSATRKLSLSLFMCDFDQSKDTNIHLPE